MGEFIDPLSDKKIFSEEEEKISLKNVNQNCDPDVNSLPQEGLPYQKPSA